ncbi:MAG: hypothetical protein ACFFHV_10880 [Promethearchaeota archaeon]
MMIKPNINLLKGFLRRSCYIPKLILNDVLKLNKVIYSNKLHLQRAIDWLLFAQKITKDGGVSSSFSLLGGWGASYPETSGYIIPTLIDYYSITKDKIYLETVKKIANWECSIQLHNGGFQGDVISKNKRTTIFNTGQVILGLVRAFKELKIESYLLSAMKAGDLLVNMQEKDGNWIKYCFNNIPHSYNVRVAWALLELAKITKENKYKEAAIKNLNWAHKQKNNNYWFHKNSFIANKPPLLHTIAYSIRGFLESGLILEDNKLKDVALNSSLKLLEYYEKYQFLPARFDSNWQSNDYYSCLTGDAQISIIWLKLYQIYKEKKFLLNAISLNNYLKSNQILDFRYKDIDGAIKGSDPIWGLYNIFSFPNWATKFFCDALILENKILSKLT